MITKKEIIESFKNKAVQYGGYSALITLGLAIGFIFLNLLFSKLSVDIDLTKDKVFSLSQETKNVLKNLSEPVNIYPLYPAGKEMSTVMQVLKKYEKLSSNINIKQIDPELNPAFTQKYDKEKTGIPEGSIIVDNGKNYKVINAYDLVEFAYGDDGKPVLKGFQVEGKITEALLYIKSGYQPKIYQLTGHKEYSLQDFQISDFIKSKNYEISDLNLVKSQGVPEDCKTLLVLSPKEDISQFESQKIKQYLENGGSCLFLFDLITETFFPNFGALLAGFGTAVQNGITFESDPGHLTTTNNPFLIAPDILQHEITQPLIAEKTPLLIPTSMGIKALDIRKRNLNIEPLLKTSDNAWIRTNLKDASFERKSYDTSGPAVLSLAVTKNKTDLDRTESFKIIVGGSSLFLGPIEPYGTIKGNINFFLNSLSWLSESKESISIISKNLYRMPLRLNSFLVLLFTGITALVIPGIILGAGIFVWIRRRHL